MNEAATIAEILDKVHTIAVIGLTNREGRASLGVSRFMQSQGYRIIPVNPEESEILGQKCYPDLDSVPDAIDIVDIFRRSELVSEIVDAADVADGRGDGDRAGARGGRPHPPKREDEAGPKPTAPKTGRDDLGPSVPD